METAASIIQLKANISAHFPAEAGKVEARVAAMGFEPESLTIWFEQFSETTTEAMRQRDEPTVRTHLDFMSRRLATSDVAVRAYIDVYYVESLMHGLDEKSKKWGWSQVPKNLRQLYVAMWGEPRFR